jgi:hypothetical protein
MLSVSMGALLRSICVLTSGLAGCAASQHVRHEDIAAQQPLALPASSAPLSRVQIGGRGVDYKGPSLVTQLQQVLKVYERQGDEGLIPVPTTKTDDGTPVTDPGGPACESVGVRCDAGGGLIRDSTLGLTEVVWVGPEDRGIYVGSPSIWKIAGGAVVASHDFFGSSNLDSTLHGTVQVLIDRSGRGDRGAIWEHAGNVTNVYWANIFSHPVHAEQLFLLGVTDCRGDQAECRRNIVISKSVTGGKSWSRAAVLFNATNRTGTYHCAPTPALVAKDGRMYRAFEASVRWPMQCACMQNLIIYIFILKNKALCCAYAGV